MAINNNPPISIHPSLDKSTMTAYINENFRKLGDAFNPLAISDGNVDRIRFGKYAANTYGIAYYDSTGELVSKTYGDSTVYYDASDARILIGKAPDDGRIGIWVSKTGVDVVTELGG